MKFGNDNFSASGKYYIRQTQRAAKPSLHIMTMPRAARGSYHSVRSYQILQERPIRMLIDLSIYLDKTVDRDICDAGVTTKQPVKTALRTAIQSLSVCSHFLEIVQREGQRFRRQASNLNSQHIELHPNDLTPTVTLLQHTGCCEGDMTTANTPLATSADPALQPRDPFLGLDDRDVSVHHVYHHSSWLIAVRRLCSLFSI